MPKKSGAKANAKGAIADGSSHILNSTASGGPTRGGSSNRGNKRRRTSNNVNSNSTELYGSGTIVAANPFDDDHHSHHHHASLSNSTTTSKMMMMPLQMAPIHQPTQMHPIYSPNYMQPMSIPPHSHNPHMNTPPGPMGSGPPMQDHLGPNQQHPPPPPHNVMHNHGGHIMPVPHQQNFGMPPHPNQTQMIGTSTPPHMMVPTPSHSPYMHHQHQQQQHGSTMLAPPHQAMTPQPQPPPPPSHVDQLLMQQPYVISNNIFCGKCQREIYQNEPNIICKAGCRSCFHISCSGLTQLACDLLMKESLAEWACDRCTSGNRRVPFVKYKT